jgi:pyruvate/2-oxoglutarate dehydrogenase complex dihydrolipoamide dehydrogenase (E3) component
MRVLQRRIYEDNDSEERLRDVGCDVIKGRGRFISPDELSVEGRTITARHFCIATGAHAVLPPVDARLDPLL